MLSKLWSLEKEVFHCVLEAGSMHRGPLFLLISLFNRLHQVSVAVCGVFSLCCGMQGL